MTTIKSLVLMTAIFTMCSGATAKTVAKDTKKRSTASSLVLECELYAAHNKKKGEFIHAFIFRTPGERELHTTTEFSIRWLTLRAKLQSNGNLVYAILELGQTEAVSLGHMNIKESLETSGVIEFFTPRKVRNSKLAPTPNHYYVTCR